MTHIEKQESDRVKPAGKPETKNPGESHVRLLTSLYNPDNSCDFLTGRR